MTPGATEVGTMKHVDEDASFWKACQHLLHTSGFSCILVLQTNSKPSEHDANPPEWTGLGCPAS